MLGDHIRTLKAGRWTHAIDCGDETVLLLADTAAPPAHVRRSYRPEFVSGADAVEVVRHRERTFPADEVVARAYSRIADPALASMFRDSEAFAEWCTTGRLPAAQPNVAISVPGVASPPAKAKAKAVARSKAARAAKPARKAKPARRAKAPARKGAKASARASRTKPPRKRSRK
jgi:hypothetical protein